jgi:hypothetical protein
MGIKTIEIQFPCEVEMPYNWEILMSDMVDMICHKWEEDNPGYIMWPAGTGSKPIWDEPNEPAFDDSCYVIGVTAREANEQEIERGRVKPKPDYEDDD